jgi:hypothetical protein
MPEVLKQPLSLDMYPTAKAWIPKPLVKLKVKKSLKAKPKLSRIKLEDSRHLFELTPDRSF